MENLFIRGVLDESNTPEIMFLDDCAEMPACTAWSCKDAPDMYKGCCGTDF